MIYGASVMVNFDFEEVFNPEEYLYFYRDILTAERTKNEIDFLVKYAKLDQPLKILDLACGHGRHANALAKLGHEVTGVDLNKGFLQVAKEEARKLNVHVNYIYQDMRELSYTEAFDRIFVLFIAIGYFDDDQNELVFRKIYEALKPNGIFCFESHNRDTYLTYHKPFSVVERENNFLIDQRSFDCFSGRSETKRSIVYKGSVKSFHISIRFYNPTDIIKIFKNIGFSSIDFYENLEGKPLGQDSKRMYVVATK